MKGLRQHTFDLFPLCKWCRIGAVFFLLSVLANWAATGIYILRDSKRHDPMEAAPAFLCVFVLPFC